MQRYKGLCILGWALIVHPNSKDWYSKGTVLRNGGGSSLIEIKRFEGGVLETKEEAEQRNPELAKA